MSRGVHPLTPRFRRRPLSVNPQRSATRMLDMFSTSHQSSTRLAARSLSAIAVNARTASDMIALARRAGAQVVGDFKLPAFPADFYQVNRTEVWPFTPLIEDGVRKHASRNPFSLFLAAEIFGIVNRCNGVPEREPGIEFHSRFIQRFEQCRPISFAKGTQEQPLRPNLFRSWFERQIWWHAGPLLKIRRR